MSTSVLVPYAKISVDRGHLEAHLDDEIADLSQLQYQLRQKHTTEPLHGLCIMTTYEPAVMWLHGQGLFYRLLFTINTMDSDPRWVTTILQYEVKAYNDRLMVIVGWGGDKVFPTLATVCYGNTTEFDARPLFEEFLLSQE